ncbi:DgyrCDS9547 [Dimorphilus gyrociliatus]|uniref:DgyrCDS9547 n=1 Tax=Dimorphilus gyrociliatus TaxID=2664684 RepID=A0A7I8VXN4_9ANNE|nr:DgyrCDS9547 [Dimorphilus gyrociliatus]
MQAPISNSEGVRQALHFPRKSSYPGRQLEFREPRAPFAVNYEPPTHKIPSYNSAGKSSSACQWPYPKQHKVNRSYNVSALDLSHRNASETKISRNAPFAPRLLENDSVFDYRGYPSANGLRADIPSYSSLHDPHLHDFFTKKFLGHVPSRPNSASTSSSRIRKSLTSRLAARNTTGKKKHDVLYKITVLTGNRKNAETKSKVFIRLKGTKAKLPRKRLSKKIKNRPGKRFVFERGSTNTFKMRGNDIGDLTSIIIEHDGITKEESWFLEQIEITNTANGKTWICICKNWLSLFEGDGKLSRELFVRQYSRTEYEIVTVTGDKLNGGTNAKVFVTFYGKHGISPKIQLRNNIGDTFERNKSDVFIVKSNCVGPIDKIRIEHDNTGLGPGWFLERVVVTDLKNKRWRYYFPCGKWLAKDEGDGRISRDLVGTLDPSKVVSGQKYKISVLTGSKSGSGTSANVYATIFGESGDSGEHKLGSSFKSGSKNEITIECPSLGNLKRVHIGHDNSGLGPGWYLEKIIVDDIKHDRVYDFPCNKWLARDEDDGLISRDLIHNVGAVGNLPGISYHLKVITGNVESAGTSARVYIIMHGSKNQTSGKVWLDNGKFDRGRTDLLEFDINENLSPISKIEIGHDDSGPGSGWFLDRVVIFCPATGIEQFFLCDKWLATDEGDGLIERTLFENTSMRKIKDKQKTWVVNVTTSNISGAGTDANVKMVLYGKNKDGVYKKTDDITLDNRGNNFEAGETDSFKIHASAVGTPYKLRIWHDNSNPAAGWHLDKIDLISPNGKIYLFNCQRWLATDEDDYEIIRELPAEGELVKKVQQLKKYKVQIITGNKRKAGTDANVYINIYGEQGDTGNRFLRNSKTNRNKFERGNTDEFIIEAVDLRKIKCIKIGHDGANFGAGWFLDKVVIEDLSNSKNKETFDVQRWFDKGEDDGLIERVIMPGGSSALQTTTYIVSVKTGNKSGAGTDANVHLKLFGEKSDTDELTLKYSDNTSNKFERGRTDVFKLEASDIGKIKMLRIGHDGSNPGSGWFLDDVSIDVPSRGEMYRFACHRWLDKSEGDGLIEIEMNPTDYLEGDIKIPHEIKVWTGDKMGGGTDANVFLQMYGESGKTEEIPLRNKTDNFERNQLDTFKIYAPDVGKILKIRIGHDGTGRGAGWYMEKLVIIKSSLVAGRRKLKKKPSLRKIGRCDAPEEDNDEEEERVDERIMERRRRKTIEKIEAFGAGEIDKIEEYWFVCQKWFAKDEDDKKIVRTLLPTTQDGKPLREGLKELDYRVIVFTADVSGAGTNANVYLSLTGDMGDSGEIHLSKSQNFDKFEQNQEDVFNLTFPDIGRLSKAKIRHDNKGIGSSWFLGHIEVEDPKRREIVYFPCQNWLSTKEGDGLLCRELVPVDRSLKDEITKSKSLSIIAAEIAKAKTIYTLNVYTGNVFKAGTDANVYVYLFGKDDSIGPIPLKHSLTYSNKFERDQVDKFQIEAVGLGTLQKLRIGHDDKNLSSDWFLDKVEIECPSEGRNYIFPCGKWLAKGKEDGLIERDLYPHEDATETYEKCIPYNFTIYTTDKIGAGTDADVFVKLFGQDTCTKQVSLCLDKRERKKKFKAGAKEDFVINLEDVGEIEKLQIGHDNSGIGAAWHLQKVEVRKLNPTGSDEKATSGSDTYIFECDKWFDKNKGDRAIVRDLVAKDVIKERRNKRGALEKKKLTRRDTLTMIKYTVDVYTGDQSGAGTNANVFLTMYGSKGDSGEQQLTKSETHFDKFERNHCDKFYIENADLGKLFKIFIRHDDSGLRSDWFLDRVEINDEFHGDKYIFYCERWLAKKKGDGKLGRQIAEKNYTGELTSNSSLNSSRKGSTLSMESHSSKSPRVRRKELENIPENPIPYTIKVQTGKSFDHGTSSNVWVNLKGSKKETGRVPLEFQTENNRFNPGSIENFSIDAEDIRKLKSIEIGHDGVSTGSGWFLEQLTVDMPTKGKSYTFQCKQWLAIDKDDGKTTRVFNVDDQDSKSVVSYSPKIPYELTLITADESGAGSDCQVSIQLFGSACSSETIHIPKRTDRFERGREDEIKFEMEDLSSITKMRVMVDGKGERSEWLLKEARVLHTLTGDKYVFKCNEWLGRGPNAKGRLSHDMVALLRGKAQLKSTNYTIMIKTTNKTHAGTSANVTLELFGEKGNSGELKLKKPKSGQKPFQKGQTDEFSFDLLSLGSLLKIRIQHDDSGFGSGWHLENVEVMDNNEKFTYKFICNKWLSKSDDDKQIIREIPCSNPRTPESSRRGKHTYEFEIITGDKKDAGIVHNCWIILCGTSGDTDLIFLRNDSKTCFKRGETATFEMKIKSVGDIQTIKVGAYARDEDRFNENAEGRTNEWFCHTVKITDCTTGDKFNFSCKDWIQVTRKPKKRYAVECNLKKKQEGSIGAIAAPLENVKYDIHVFTGDEPQASTDSNVFITIFGKFGDSGKRKLTKKFTNLFEKGNKDTFTIDCVDLGDLTKIKIEHDGSSFFKTDWFLDKVEVYKQTTGSRVVFPCNQWLSKKRGDRQTWRELLPQE